MAQVIARIDFYNPKWDSEEMVEVFRNGTDEEKKEWMLNNCKLELPEDCDLYEVYDSELAKGDDFLITYSDWGMIEEVKMIKFNSSEL